MLFTSFVYFLFLTATLLLYYILPARFRMYFLIAVSAAFYMYVKVEYIFIILFIILSNYWIGINISKSSIRQKQKNLLYLSLFINLGILIFFKYWNFLLGNLFAVLGIFQIKNPFPLVEVALPLGLSFYIFQVMGYIYDIYRGSQKPEKNIFRFSFFMIFFPKLLVGPIERAGRFLPQLTKRITFEKENIIEGSRRIAWGLFKKLVVADRISIYENVVMVSVRQQGGITILFATLIYVFQVYADFSGYTDIAIGTARLFGYDLMENFKRPLFAKNLSDFWRRWHISLSSWVNDYIFNPIIFKRRDWGNGGVYYGLFISFIIIGIWHGATWNYVLFGAIQAIALIYEVISRKTRKKIAKKININLYNGLSVLLTFLYTSFSLIIFRTDSLSKALQILKGIFAKPGHLFYDKPSTLLFILIGIFLMLVYDLQKEYKPLQMKFYYKSWKWQQLAYALLLISILLAGVFDGGQFIYFAF
jgi:alginate O-acetyltransferase complex protein AlgI